MGWIRICVTERVEMSNVLRNRPPQIADVQCSRLTFQPGDRTIVRMRVNIDNEQRRKLRKSIQKFAGCEVEVLIINELEMDIEVAKGMAGMPCPMCGKVTGT